MAKIIHLNPEKVQSIHTVKTTEAGRWGPPPEDIFVVGDQITPWPIMALATFMKPAMLAPFM